MLNKSDLIIKTSDFIEKNLKELLDIDGVSRAFSTSSTYLNRAYKKCLGYSAIDYLKMRKITQGIKRGVEGRGNLVDIAFEYNFNSHEVFLRNCKRYFNRTPRELIKLEDWKGCSPLSHRAVWFLTNLKYIEVTRVRLPKLELVASGRGEFRVFFRSSVFRGRKASLEWDASRIYKLIPPGIYDLYSISRDREYSSLGEYLLESNLGDSPIIEYRKEEMVLFYKEVI